MAKLSADEIQQLVLEKEQELDKEEKRLAFQKSLHKLIKKMEKENLYIGRVMFAHTIKEEADRWTVRSFKTN